MHNTPNEQPNVEPQPEPQHQPAALPETCSVEPTSEATSAAPDAAPAAAEAAPAAPDAAPAAAEAEPAAPDAAPAAPVAASAALKASEAPTRPARVKMPSAAQLKSQRNADEAAAHRVLWGYCATESRDEPTEAGVTVELLADALDLLGLDWQRLASRIQKLRAAQLSIRDLDSAAVQATLPKLQEKWQKAKTKADEMRARATEIEKAAESVFMTAQQDVQAARAAESKAAQLFNSCMIAGCPASVNLGLRTKRRVMRVTRASIEMDKPVDVGQIINYGGPDRPWLEDYDGPVEVGGFDVPDTQKTVNEANEAIAAAVEKQHAKFTDAGLPGKELVQQLGNGITSRPTLESDFPVVGPNNEPSGQSPLPTMATISSRPTTGEIPPQPQPPFDPWA